jgi:hypothetical protein
MTGEMTLHELLPELEVAVLERLDRGELARRGPVRFPDGEELPDAEVAARTVLADAAHLQSLEYQGMQPTPAQWTAIVADLVVLLNH